MWKRRQQRKKWLKGAGLALAAAGVVLAFYALSLFGPRTLKRQERRAYQGEDNATQQMREQVARQEEKLDRLEKVTAAGENELGILEQTLTLQKEIVERTFRSRKSDVERLERLQRRYNGLQAKRLHEESLKLERAGKRSLEFAEESRKGLKQLNEALALQEKINKDYAGTIYRDISRRIALRSLIVESEAQPLYQKSLEREKALEIFMDEGKWDEAQAALAQSIALQEKINRLFKASNYDKISRLERLKKKQTVFRLERISFQIETQFKEAKKRESESRFQEAAESYRQTAQLQRKLNALSPNSRHSSVEKLVELETLRQNVLSRHLSQAIIQTNAQLGKSLANENVFQAIEHIVALYKKAKILREEYPKNTHISPALSEKIQFLYAIREDMESLQKSVVKQLLPIDGNAGWLLFRTEVPQALFYKLTESNPSRNKGDLLPVDSVTRAEANAFCRRMGWLLGREARLPSRELFEKAVAGERQSPALPDSTWNIANSGRKPQPVGAKAPAPSGFHDLLGNVGEWLAPETARDDETGLIAGGHACDSAQDLAKIPFLPAPKNERNRLTGFRFTVRD